MDRTWWDKHIIEVRQTFSGALFTTSHQCKRYGLEPMGTYGRGFDPCGNSGAGCIALAHLFGAARVGLLGYDCALTGGRTHWHGDHPKGLGNAGSVGKWPEQFRRLAAHIGGLAVFNCSRSTALTQWPRQTLEQFLAFDSVESMSALAA
jgi:hypothetical protein